MKIRLEVGKERYAQIEKELLEKGFQIDETADLILYEKGLYIDHLIVKNLLNHDKVRISTDEIICIESYGHDIEVYTLEGCYKTGDRLHQLITMLDPAKFIRISNSVIISRDKVRKIKPTFHSKFILTMVNGRDVDVTRSYYHIFKDYFHI